MKKLFAGVFLFAVELLSFRYYICWITFLKQSQLFDKVCGILYNNGVIDRSFRNRKGGEDRDGDFFIFRCFCRSRCSFILHMQVAGQALRSIISTKILAKITREAATSRVIFVIIRMEIIFLSLRYYYNIFP